MDIAFRECKFALLFKHAFKKIRCYQKLNKEMRSSGATWISGRRIPQAEETASAKCQGESSLNCLKSNKMANRAGTISKG